LSHMLGREMKYISFLNKIVPGIDGDGLIKISKMVSSNGTIAHSNLWCVVSLLEAGYAVDELTSYFKGIDINEAVEPIEAAQFLAFTIFHNEIFTMERTKIFPTYLVGSYRVANRKVKELTRVLKHPEDSEHIGLFNKRATRFEHKGNGYSIVPISKELLMSARPADRPLIISESYSGHDTLFYVKRSSQCVRINIFGNNIVSLSEKMTDKQLANLHEWADKNNVFYSDDIHVLK